MGYSVKIGIQTIAKNFAVDRITALFYLKNIFIHQFKIYFIENECNETGNKNGLNSIKIRLEIDSHISSGRNPWNSWK